MFTKPGLDHLYETNHKRVMQKRKFVKISEISQDDHTLASIL